MRSLLRSSQLLGLAALVLLACGGDDGDGGASSGGSSSGASGGASGGGSSSGASGGSSGGGGGGCLDPAAFDWIVKRESTPSTQDLLLYQATPDGETSFYASSVEAVHRIDVAAKTMTDVYAPPGAIVPRHFVRAEDVIVSTSKKLWSVPRGGGAPTALPDWTRGFAASLAGTAEVQLDGDALYALESGDGGAIFKHELATGIETVLATEPRASNAALELGADALYGYYPNDETTNAPTTLWKLPKSGGALTPLTLDGAPSAVNYPLGVRGDQLFVLSLDTTAFEAHVLRTSTSGGAVTDVGKTVMPIVFKGQSYLYPAAGGTVIQLVSSLYWLPDGAATMTPLACVDGDFTAHAATALGKKVYLNVVGTTASGVIAIPLP